MIRQVSILTGLAIIGVVVHHSVHWVITAMFWWTDMYRPVTIPNYDQLWSINYLIVRMVDQLAVIGFAAFFFVSGMFVSMMTGRSRKTIPVRALFPRIKNLLIPFLLWSSIALLFNIIFGQSYTINDILQIPFKGVTIGYYFIPLLIIFYLISPLLVRLANERWKLLLGIAAVIHFAMIFLYYAQFLGWKFQNEHLQAIIDFMRNWPLLGTIFWFIFGMVVGFHLSVFMQWLLGVKKLLYIGLIIFYFASIIEWAFIRQVSGREWISTQVFLCSQVYVFLFLLSFFTLESSSIPFHKQIARLGSKSYGIFLIHPIIMVIIAKSVYHLVPMLLGLPLIFQALLVLSGIGIPLAMMEIVNRSPVRKYYSWIFG
jgi:peptidoglycan/LPS O-acetylase OafA/YrhL